MVAKILIKRLRRSWALSQNGFWILILVYPFICSTHPVGGALDLWLVAFNPPTETVTTRVDAFAASYYTKYHILEGVGSQYQNPASVADVTPFFSFLVDPLAFLDSLLGSFTLMRPAGL